MSTPGRQAVIQGDTFTGENAGWESTPLHGDLVTLNTPRSPADFSKQVMPTALLVWGNFAQGLLPVSIFWPFLEVSSDDLSLHKQPRPLSTSFPTRLIAPFSCDEDFVTSSCYWLPQVSKRVVCRSSKLLRIYIIISRQVIVASLREDSDRGKPEYLEKNLSKCQTFHQKSQKCKKIFISVGLHFGYLNGPHRSKMKEMRSV